MKMLRPLLAAGAVALATLTPAHAQTLIFTTEMSGPAEAPPNNSPGRGVATLTMDTDDHLMHVQTTFVRLLSPVTIAHVHCCTPVPGEGIIAPATSLPTFPGFPTGVTQGIFNATFDMLDPASYNPTNPTFATAVDAEGVFSPELAFNTFVQGLTEGRAYFNIHTALFPGGEIRGFLQPLVPIPEPSTYALLLAGLGLVGWAAARRGAG
jgi:hypothetical protein